MKRKLWDQVLDQVYDQVWYPVEAHVCDPVWYPVGNQVGAQVIDQVEENQL